MKNSYKSVILLLLLTSMGILLSSCSDEAETASRNTVKDLVEEVQELDDEIKESDLYGRYNTTFVGANLYDEGQKELNTRYEFSLFPLPEDSEYSQSGFSMGGIYYSGSIPRGIVVGTLVEEDGQKVFASYIFTQPDEEADSIFNVIYGYPKLKAGNLTLMQGYWMAYPFGEQGVWTASETKNSSAMSESAEELYDDYLELVAGWGAFEDVNLSDLLESVGHNNSDEDLIL